MFSCKVMEVTVLSHCSMSDLEWKVVLDDLRDEGFAHSGAAEQHQDTQLTLTARQEAREKV